MTTELLFEMMASQPVAMLERTLGFLLALRQRERAGRATSVVADVSQHLQSTQARPWTQAGSVAVLPVQGLIMQHPSVWSMLGFATSTEDLVGQIRAAIAEPTVASVLLDIESPGGFVYGTPEAAAAILALREQKPIHAIANAYAASAAYWLAASATTLTVIPSGEVGSIGVFAVHEDWSKAYAEAGVTPTLIKAGKYKAETTELAPLTDEAREELQRAVDESYEQFVSGVARGRGVSVAAVRAGFGQGRMVSAEAAVEAGMADRVGTLDDLLGSLAPRLRGARADARTRARAFFWQHEQGR